MGKYTNNPKAGGAGGGGDEEKEEDDGGQGSHFMVGAIKMIPMSQSAVYHCVFQFFDHTGCGAENQQRQKDKVKLFMHKTKQQQISPNSKQFRYKLQFQKESKKELAESREHAHNPIQVILKKHQIKQNVLTTK